jgi:aminoglycoside phosphotransferase (APT) family kinase protein
MYSPSRGLDRLIEAMSPGSRVIRVRRLRGGLGAQMHVVSFEATDGKRTRVVVRRPRPDRMHSATFVHAKLHYEKFVLAARMGIPAPRPLFLDAEGAYTGLPAMVLSYLPGRPLLVPRDLRQWAGELATALCSVHAVDPSHVDLSGLPIVGRAEIEAEIERRWEEAMPEEPLARELYEALKVRLDRIHWPPATLVHDDFWPGNTVWSRGHLVGIIDWTIVVVGDPRADVSQCRLDLTISLGREAADAFLGAYQSLAPVPLPDVCYFDLFQGLRALLSYEKWIPGYHDLGLTELDPEVAGARLRAFLRRTLDQSA